MRRGRQRPRQVGKAVRDLTQHGGALRVDETRVRRLGSVPLRDGGQPTEEPVGEREPLVGSDGAAEHEAYIGGAVPGGEEARHVVGEASSRSRIDPMVR